MLMDTRDKQAYFNRYWQTRDLPTADARSIQRADTVKSLLGEPRGQRVIEVGCGRGTVMSRLNESGYNVCGCDISSEPIAALNAGGWDVFLCDIESDPLPETYDGILCLEVLQQLFDPVSVLRKLSSYLKDDGVLIISVPNEFHLWSRLMLLIGRSHLGHFDESHIRLFSPTRARSLFTRAGLRIDKVRSLSVMPPGMKFLERLGRLLTAISPGLFALSQVYRVKRT